MCKTGFFKAPYQLKKVKPLSLPEENQLSPKV